MGTLGLKVVYAGRNPVVDIIAVHGLGARPDWAWVYKTGERDHEGNERLVNWLSDADMLPSQMPDSRIMTFNYESQWILGDLRQRQSSCATQLLTALDNMRNEEPDTMHRPILFIGHSFGGILIEQALVNTSLSKQHQYLVQSTIGVFFLGTPHRGSASQKWGQIIANSTKLMGFHSDDSILRDLAMDSGNLIDLVDHFVRLASRDSIAVICFFEQHLSSYNKGPNLFRALLPWKEMVVEESSACIPGYPRIPLATDHFKINKYNGPDDVSYQVVSATLKKTVGGYLVQTFNGAALKRAEEKDQQPCILPFADGAAFNSLLRQHQPVCLEDTRVDLIRQINEWSDNPYSATIYWLCGMAGTGKSTISTTLSKQWYQEKRLGASFFFSRGHADLSQIKYLFTTIAFQLSNSLPSLRPHINKAIADNPDICQRSLHEQWQYLIYHPLSKLGPSADSGCHQTRPHILVIDALDECDDERDVKLMLQLISRLQGLDGVLRVFITSRPEHPIRLGFEKMSKGTHLSFILHDIQESIVQYDIYLYISEKLKEVRRLRQLPEDWPPEESIEHLCRKAGKLFIYAATACRFINHSMLDPQERLSQLLQERSGQRSTAATGALDAMYFEVFNVSLMRSSDREDTRQISSLFKRVIGTIVLLFDPLPSNALARLLHLKKATIDGLLGCLGSVIHVQERDNIRLFHPSFRDFLIDHTRCIDPRFSINEPMAHMDILLNCLTLMSTSLRRDICNLERPGVLRSEINNVIISEHLSLDIQYACNHWVNHLKACQTKDLKISGAASDQILEFFQTHFLHWLEALSLLQKLSEGVLALGILQNIMTASLDGIENDPTGLLSFIADAKRFLLKNKPEIEKAPLQVYCSALLFSPTSSIVKSQYRGEAPHWIEIRSTGHVTKDWDPLIQVCEGHSESVSAVAFSPDGTLLASGSGDNNVRIWDPFTGACQSTLNGHSGYVYAVAFSPDGKLLASGSYDYTVRLWDPFTGACQSTLNGHSGFVDAVAFSPDGMLLASGSYDKTVRLWDPFTGACQSTLNGHSRSVTALAFSIGRKFLASGSEDMTVTLWDPDTAACQITLKGHSSWVTAVAFSPDGRHLASASFDKTVRLWDPFTGACQSTLNGHSKSVTAVAFSPDGKLLASASYDKTVRLWDRVTGVCQRTLKGHSNWVTAVAFSPDGKLLASGSYDNTVRLWDPFTEACQSTLESTSNCVTSVAFSPDAMHLASGSDDHTVRLWDPLTGACHSTLNGHSETVTSVAFSPDGKFLASGSVDKTVRLWDLITAACQSTLKGHYDRMTSVAFSPDGKLLASGSGDTTVRLWDRATGLCQSTLKGHSNWVTAVAFSPDGMLLASGSYDNTVRLWDPFTEACQSTLKGHSDCVRAVAFSPDGNLLASGSDDSTVRLWDIPGGKHLQSLNTSSVVSQMTFSVNDSCLETDQGNFEIAESIHGCDPQNGCSLVPMSGCTDWILWGGERLVMLPVDMRPFRQAIRSNIIAMGYESGRVAILALDVGSLPIHK